VTHYVRFEKMKESDFQQAIITLAETCGWLVYHVANVQRQLRSSTSVGFPDLILVKQQKLVAWECKIPPNKPTYNQNIWIKALQLAGVECRVITPDDWSYIQDILMMKGS